jgi:hypothetical protein
MIGGHGRLVTGKPYLLQQLAPVKGLPAAVSLDDRQRRVLDVLVCREPLTAIDTFSPTADGLTIAT